MAIASGPEFFWEGGFNAADEPHVLTPLDTPEIADNELWTPGVDAMSTTPDIILPGQLTRTEQMIMAYDARVLALTHNTPDIAPRGKSYRGTPFDQCLPHPGERLDLRDLPRVMGNLAVNAHTADLAHLRYGLVAYMLVTEACIAVLPDKPESNRQFPGLDVEFDFPEKIGRTMPVFFDELVKAFDLHVQGRPEAVQGWFKKFYLPEARDALPAQAMLDFLTVHVRYDLPVALARTGTLDKHEADYTEKVNQVLTHVAMQIMPLYAKVALPTFPGAAVEKLGLRMALNELFGARDEAWNAFKYMERVTSLKEFAALRKWQLKRTESQLVTGRKGASLMLRALLREEPHKWPVDDLPDLSQVWPND